MSDLTNRERFCAVLWSGPLLSADAIIVLAGEDGVARAQTAVELFRSGAAPVIVLSGGLHQPPRIQSGEHLSSIVLGGGVAPDRIFHEPALHTQEQATAITALSVEQHWRRLLLVASPYHLPRAFLTFVRALHQAQQHETIRLVAVPASHTFWFHAVPGAPAEETRLATLAVEFEKCGRYAEHVATWSEGLDYLRYWEGR